MWATCSEVCQRWEGLHISIEPPQSFIEALRLRFPADSTVICVTMLVTEITIFYRIKANVHLSGEKGRRKLLLVFISTDEITAVDNLQRWPQWSLAKFLSHIIPELNFVTKRTWQRVCDFQDQIIEDMIPLSWWCCPWLLSQGGFQPRRPRESPTGQGTESSRQHHVSLFEWILQRPP